MRVLPKKENKWICVGVAQFFYTLYLSKATNRLSESGPQIDEISIRGSW